MALQVIFDGIAFGASLALMSIGLTLVFSILGIVNFAHGAMFMVGAYVAFWLTAKVGISYYAAVLGAGVAVALLGAALAILVFRRFAGLLLEGGIAAVALALLLVNTAFVAFSAIPQNLEGGITGVVEVGGAHLIGHRIFIIAVAIVLSAAIAVFVGRTRWGRALRAVEQDAWVAQLQGINVHTATVVTFVIGGFLAGVAGALIAPERPLLPSMGDAPLLLAFVVIIVGGMGSIRGAVIAALAIGLLQSVVSAYWVAEAATWTSFAVAILVLLIRPRGLFGHA